MQDDGSLISTADQPLIRTRRPIPLSPGDYYFETKIVNAGRNDQIWIGLAPKDAPNIYLGTEANSLGLRIHDGIVHHECITVGEVLRLSKGSVAGIHIRVLDTVDEHDEDDQHVTATFLIVNFTIDGKKGPTRLLKANGLDLYPSIGFGKKGQVVEATFRTESAYDAASKFLSALTDMLHLQKKHYFQIQKSI